MALGSVSPNGEGMSKNGERAGGKGVLGQLHIMVLRLKGGEREDQGRTNGADSTDAVVGQADQWWQKNMSIEHVRRLTSKERG